jgi:trans-aconitate methyltransferase
MMLGLYERPLQQALETLVVTRDYDLVVDIGSADGFYAVGLAMRCPKARVIAFDTEPRARKATAAMAQCNGVGDRVSVRGFCRATDLVDVVRDARRALVLSDCEGYERQLFPQGSGTALARHDVAIELHDWIDYAISPQLRSVFRETHAIETLRAPDDLEWVRSAHMVLPELEAFNWNVRHALLSENRRNIPGEWLVGRSRLP